MPASLAISRTEAGGDPRAGKAGAAAFRISAPRPGGWRSFNLRSSEDPEDYWPSYVPPIHPAHGGVDRIAVSVLAAHEFPIVRIGPNWWGRAAARTTSSVTQSPR